jgi:aldehyde dehydrogenase (NAD+)
MTIKEIFETMDYGPAPEGATEALAWIASHGGRFGCFIDGSFSDVGETFPTKNPATGETLAEITQATQADVDRAVAAARKAQPGWAALGGHGRAKVLYAIARIPQKQSRLFAVLETLDNGKPIRESRDIDIPLAQRHFYHHAGYAELMETQLPDRAPLGVCGQVIPWNFPLLMLAWKVAPALAMGNTVVLKPAEYTSLTALLFADLCRQAGVPKGVLNVVTGDGAVGEMVVKADVEKVAFTGSTAVGRIIREATAGTGKSLTLELGGKSPYIVFDDADMDSAVEGLVDAIWFNQGQVCCAGSRLLVQEGVANAFYKKLKSRMDRLRIGDPLDKAIDIGAIVAPAQLQKIEALVSQGVDEGATKWQPSWACPTEGYFFPPTLFTNVAPASNIAQVEIFGPVLVSMTFRTPDEAIALANNTRFGLAASIWSEDINVALHAAARIKAGVVWVNSTNLFDAAAGFGGYRESGFGREGGKEGLYEYVRRVEQPPTGSPAAVPEGRPARARRSSDSNGKAAAESGFALPPIDRTPKLYIGGKQARPDGGVTRPVYGPHDELLGEVADGNRKDIRNAVEAARAAGGWSGQTAHARAQILYYLAENLSARAGEFAARIQAQTGRADAQHEVDLAIERLFTYAAWADKYDGLVHSTPVRNATLAMVEPIGTIALVAPDEYPLLGAISLLAPAICLGNTVVLVPSERAPLSATDLYQVFDTSDLPGGVVNIVTGGRDSLAKVLAEHNDIDAIWYWGGAEGSAMVERASVGNLKQTWVSYGKARAWLDRHAGEGEEFLRHASQIKNIWVPYGA